eukprot:137471-Prorocentrum_minimum.AAC.1
MTRGAQRAVRTVTLSGPQAQEPAAAARGHRRAPGAPRCHQLARPRPPGAPGADRGPADVACRRHLAPPRVGHLAAARVRGAHHGGQRRRGHRRGGHGGRGHVARGGGGLPVL